MIRSNQAKQEQQHRGFFHTTSPLVNQQPSQNLPHNLHTQSLLQKCIKFQKQIFVQKLEDQSRKIVDNLIYSIKVFNENKVIVPILIKKTQQGYLQFFSDVLFRNLEKLNYNEAIKEQNQNQIASQSKYEKKKYSFIQQKRKLNIYKTSQQSILRIALSINKKIKCHTIKGTSIYWNERIVQLTSEGLDILEKVNQLQCSIIILPTFYSFKKVNFLERQVEVIPFTMFQDKDAFLSLMYKCICDEDIRAYLPKQSLKLINDFDDFPITYTEGAHRLIYCIQRLQILRQKTQKKFKYVDIKPILKSIEKTLKKILGFLLKQNQMIEMFIQIMLDPRMKVNMLYQFLSKRIFYKTDYEQIILNKFKKDLFKTIQNQIKDAQTAEFCFSTLNEDTVQIKEWKRKKQFNKKEINHKQLIFFFQTSLESKINKIINLFTDKIQNEAKHFSWQQFHFVDTIKPPLPHNIYSSVYNNTKFLKEIKEFILSDQKTNASLQKIVQKFSKNRQEVGALMYMLRELEQYGLAFFSFEKRKGSKKGYFLNIDDFY